MNRMLKACILSPRILSLFRFVRYFFPAKGSRDVLGYWQPSKDLPDTSAPPSRENPTLSRPVIHANVTNPGAMAAANASRQAQAGQQPVGNQAIAELLHKHGLITVTPPTDVRLISLSTVTSTSVLSGRLTTLLWICPTSPSSWVIVAWCTPPYLTVTTHQSWTLVG